MALTPSVFVYQLAITCVMHFSKPVCRGYASMGLITKMITVFFVDYFYVIAQEKFYCRKFYCSTDL